MRVEGSLARCVVAMVLLGGLAGCQALFGRHGLPEDPLFVDRKPLESKVDTTRPLVPVWSEPSPPAPSHPSPAAGGGQGGGRRQEEE
jgi:hypothetical protein